MARLAEVMKHVPRVSNAVQRQMTRADNCIQEPQNGKTNDALEQENRELLHHIRGRLGTQSTRTSIIAQLPAVAVASQQNSSNAYIQILEQSNRELQLELNRRSSASDVANLPASWGVDTTRNAAVYMLSEMKEDSYSYFVGQ